MEQLFAAIPSIVKGLDPNESVAEAVVFAAWAQVAGEPIRIRTEPLEFAGKRLVVGVEDETWQRNLEALAAPMVAKLNAMLGDGTVSYITFQVR